MAFNPIYSSFPMISYNIGMPDLPITFPCGETILQSVHDKTTDRLQLRRKGGSTITQTPLTPQAYYQVTTTPDLIGVGVRIPPSWFLSLPFVVEPSVYDKKDWCKVSAYDTTRYNYPTYPLVVFFKAFQRKIEQQNVVVKYDDEVGTIIPLSQKQFDVLTFTTQPMNSDYARLLLDIAEWDNVTFQYWDKENNAWSTAINVVKKAESWQKTTYPKTLGTTIQGSFIIKQ